MAATLTPDYEVQTTQLFNRAALGNLRARRAEFDNNTEKLLNSLSNNRKKGTLQGTQEITYKLARTRAAQLGFGRLYGTKGSLEQLQSECRATLCADAYHDIDIVNAQPTLLIQLARKLLKRDIPELEEYVDNRDQFLQTLIDRDNCSREEAKNQVICVLFGGTTKDPLLQPLSTKIRTVAKEFAKLPQYTELFESLQHEKNHYGSFLAYITQTEERHCMLAMRQWLMDQGWSVDVLAYDGVMIRKRKDVPITPELLTDLEAAVLTATGYTVRIIEKPMTGFDVNVMQDEDDVAYAEMKAKFEENHFYFGSVNSIVEQAADGLHQMSIEHAMTYLNTWLLPGKNKKDEPELFIKKWIKDPQRRFVKRLVYKMPADCDADEASLFIGFAYKQMEGDDPAAIALFMDILRACCGDDETVTNYVLKYFAHCIQRPFESPGTAIIFTSRTHGTGKDTLLNTMRRIIGHHSKHYGSETHFWDKHDTGKEGAILIHLEEACARANKAKAGELKQMVTGEQIDINPKGMRMYSVPNVCRIVMTTNEPDPVKLEESDRRFVIINPSNRLHAKGLQWWADIQEQLKSSAFLGTVGRMLETLDISFWNPRVMPMTEYKKELHEMSKQNEEMFFEALVHDAEHAPASDLRPEDIYAVYKQWWYKQGMDSSKMRISPNSLMLASMHLAGKYFTKRRISSGMLYRLIIK
jgi:hypothetical protein